MNELISKIEYSVLREDEREAYLQQHFFAGDERKLVRARLAFVTPEKVSFELISSIPPSSAEVPFKPFSDRDNAIYVTLNEDRQQFLAAKNIRVNDIVACRLVKLPERHFRCFSIDINSIEKLDNAKSPSRNDSREFLSYLQGFIKQHLELDYDFDILRSVCLGLQTRQLIVLTGRPGTGKTSLVRALARAFSPLDAIELE